MENLLDRRGRKRCLRQLSKCNFGVVWPWPLTSWPQKLNVSVSPLASRTTCANVQQNRSFSSFSKYRVHKTAVTDERTDIGHTDKQTDRQTDRSRTLFQRLWSYGLTALYKSDYY